MAHTWSENRFACPGCHRTYREESFMDSIEDDEASPTKLKNLFAILVPRGISIVVIWDVTKDWSAEKNQISPVPTAHTELIKRAL
ncbi:hypothetical protein GE061_020266 [Apolygus lucorum]|uniref:Uncharacterized protein n=1 Tax=Apolygus lucorum TaxID=248454 RepID=A0A8S9WJ18_APOLU|nr:hypothetical protein GE061_020266 [Apolygus lucorum]